FAFEQGVQPTNERLEFLGDAVLGLIVTDLAYRTYPGLSEGELAKLRAAMVNMTMLAEVAKGLGLGEAVLLGRGEELSGGRHKASILADAMEAVFGAVYLDRGIDAARQVIEGLFRPRIESYVRGEGDRDYKTSLQELAAQDPRRIRDVDVRPQRNAMRIIRRHARRKEFADLLAGRKIMKVDRKGKYLLLFLDQGEVLVVHFGMSGQFLRGTKRQALSPHTHVVI